MKILFTGGGTGGHIFPIIAIVREIRRIQIDQGRGDFEFFYIGPKDNYSAILLANEGIKVKGILAGKIRRYHTKKSFLENFIDVVFKIPIGFIQSFFHIFFLAPDVIFSKGGYGSVPAVIAGWTLATPIFLHESDVVPGISNRKLSKFAMEIFTSFPRTEYFSSDKMVLVGNPIRKDLLNGSKAKAKQIFEITGEKPIILVLGGSQGAQRINDMVLAGLPKILQQFEVVHQTGDKNLEQVKSEAEALDIQGLGKYYHLVPFLKETELSHAYQICDLVVSRAGAGILFEIAVMGKPSILIPLAESAQGHQVKNAHVYSETGAALVIEEQDLDSLFFLERLINLCFSTTKMEEMSRKAKEFSKPYAARVIAGYIVDYLSWSK
jgi:UDP-N-acetylglucosamine--N-acetylmuramyl-(pentapeptide) pyrophosphoryl-undecaprenol N-acetylglucosamine transferase